MSRYLIHWLLAAACIAITALLVPGFTVTNFVAALAAALVIALLNMVVWPLLVVMTFPVTILTFGLFLFVLNAVILKLGSFVVPGFEITGFLPALLGALVLAVVGAFSRYLTKSTT